MFGGGHLLNEGLASASGLALQLCLSDQERAAGTAHHKTQVLNAGQNGASGMTSSGPLTDEHLSLWAELILQTIDEGFCLRQLEAFAIPAGLSSGIEPHHLAVDGQG